MRFSIVKREVEMGWNHLWFVIGIMLVIGTAIFTLTLAIAGAISYSSGIPFMDSYRQAVIFDSTIVSLVSMPLTAFAFIFAMPYFKLKKDAASCRSVAATQFIVSTIFIMALNFLAMASVGVDLSPSLSWLFQILEWVFTHAQSAILLYLWMLIFLKNDVEGVKRSALPAILAAAAISAFIIMAQYSMVEVFGLGTMPKIGLNTLIVIIDKLWFALPLIVFMPKKLDDAAYFFAGIYLCGVISSAINSYYFMLFGSDYARLTLTIIDGIASLVIIYIAANYDRKS